MAPTPAPDIELPAVRAQRESTAAARVGCSNTRPTLKFENAPGVQECGVDTIRFLFKGTREYGSEIFEAGRFRAHWMPGHSLLALEGHPVDGALGDDGQVEDAYYEALEVAHGEMQAPTYEGTARLDTTATYRFSSGTEGLAFLSGMAAMDWPRCKVGVYGTTGAIETVYLLDLRSRGRKLARGYDKGIEAGFVGVERGEYVRLEDQGRFRSGHRPDARQMQGYPRARFEKRFRPLWQASQGLKVASFPVLAEEVRDRVASGSITLSQARRALGFICLGNDPLTRPAYSTATYYRHKAELRELGLVVADGIFEPVEVDMASVLEAALDSPAWGHG